ncbi:FKBP-type peptidyl-prolyl cis-trans isomerase N-terminal domain-containing protein [Winslowiella iniecta]|uniref:FKBP-type peptidyl-prolyl cis-trans isomerase N-terminal domain-containing protein n=1 Tax=Winslowiella iniecta TaxID=1560201 RepID=UPI00069F7063|nr:FKBP-type peptidyl-prolyl cis-trans isomerase N-terminal domain-containing protein [Winslowiella iniecta]
MTWAKAVSKQQRAAGLLLLMGGAMLYPASASADNQDAGVPAILQFAEHYQQKQASPAESSRQQQSKKPPAARPEPVSSPAKSPAWRLGANDQEVKRLQLELNLAQQRQQALQAANDRLTEAVNFADVPVALAGIVNHLKQALTPAPELSVQRQQLSRLRHTLAERQNELTALKQQYAGLTKRWQQTQAQLPSPLSQQSIQQAKVRQDYAAGVSLGSEILALQAEHARWGISADKAVILAGINDAFEHKSLLSPAEVNDTLAEVESAITAAREKAMAAQQQQGRDFQAKFARQPATKAAAMGYWYQIDYAGKGKITPDAVVEIAVKEMRVDGKVIQDMDASGAVLTQKLSEYPPVFRDALARLENHGSMTLLVPPELAYGDAGYPPDIPPAAYMIYTIRVADVYPEKVAKSEG